MSKSTRIINARIVNEGQIAEADVLISQGRIHKIAGEITDPADEVVDLNGQLLIPGLIDDQVHFREPGLTHKAEIRTESRAAVAGGVTSFMEMPNTKPPALTQELLQDKYEIAARNSIANYSFFMGVSNDNLEEVLKTDPNTVCGIKVFLGSSTGNMLVDNENTLDNLFSRVQMLIAAHCEDEQTIRNNHEFYRQKYGENIPIAFHPLIRSEEACFLSSSHAVALARKHGTRFHVLHISTGKETSLFDNSIPLEEKKITSEACTHHLWFSDEDYEEKGTLIKWNPAVKTAADRAAIRQAVIDGRIDILATDHAPHTLEEKENPYDRAPSGGPLVQHNLPALMELVHQDVFPLELVIQKACHNPAILFRIRDRGFIREGYHADLVSVNLNDPWTVSKENILAKCGWSPFEGTTFQSRVTNTWVNGVKVFDGKKVIEGSVGDRMLFNG